MLLPLLLLLFVIVVESNVEVNTGAYTGIVVVVKSKSVSDCSGFLDKVEVRLSFFTSVCLNQMFVVRRL